MNSACTALNDLAASIYSAMLKDLPNIEYAFREPGSLKEIKRSRRPELRDVEVFLFPQTWGTTALGFGGQGCSATTEATTTVVSSQCRLHAAVYFEGRFAYLVSSPGDEFWSDVLNHHMATINHMKKYQRKP